MRSSNDDHRDQYVFHVNDEISAEDPAICYRWRGNDIQDIIQLASDSTLHQMTFSNGGNNVEDTWSHPDGSARFTGVKRGDTSFHRSAHSG